MLTGFFKGNYKYGLFSGVLLALNWNAYFPAVSLFLAFIPLLYVQKYLKPGFIEYFNISLLAFIIFHLGTVWWIYKSSISGFVVVITLNSLLMASVMSFHYFVAINKGKYLGYLSFVVFWLAFEFLHYHWEISWPFMNLGNWLGQIPEWVQWYEFTGVLGGTLWILFVNIFLFLSGDLFFQNKKNAGGILMIFSIILLVFPITISYQIISKPIKNDDKLSVLIVQPNINPYAEKYKSSLFEQQIKEQIEMAEENINPQTHLIIFPETSFPLYLNQDSLFADKNIKKIRKLTKLNKGVDIIAGIYTYKIDENDTLFSNTAVYLNSATDYTLYNKSKLVPAVEKTPFAQYFGFLRDWNVNFGGITSSLGISNHRKVFETKHASIAPVICYESVYGEFINEFVSKGADIIVVMTNDAWWGDTPAYEQILMHSRLRAIESRRSVVRSANTGISCLIDKYGAIKNSLPKNEKSVLSVLAEKNNMITFYVKNGNFIGRYSVYVSLVLLFLIILAPQTKQTFYRK